jgi:hypothetical protein
MIMIAGYDDLMAMTIKWWLSVIMIIKWWFDGDGY